MTFDHSGRVNYLNGEMVGKGRQILTRMDLALRRSAMQRATRKSAQTQQVKAMLRRLDKEGIR